MSQTKVSDALRNVTAVDAAKLTGTVDNARITLDAAEIPSLDADKITTGSIGAARIPAGAVTQHVQATDLTAVHQAIASLGLHTAVSDNKASYNLPNAFIDQFEDDTGIATETTIDRNASEYVSSVSESFGTPAYVTGNRASSITLTSNVVVQGSTGGAGVQNLINGNTNSFYFASQNVAGLHFTFQWTVKQKITEARWYNDEADDSQGQGYWKWQGSNDGTAWTDIGSSFQLINTGMVGGAGGYQELTTLSGNTTGYFYYKMLGVSGTCGTYSNHQELDFKQVAASTISNATGTLVSTVQTAPVATTTLSGVILYTDEAGTNALDTDLKLYLTANLQGTTPNWTGTTWTDVGDTDGDGGGYGTPQTFSGTTKQVKLGKTTVTSGTQIAMKAVWANQAATVAEGTTNRETTTGVAESGTIANLFDNNNATHLGSGGGPTQYFYTDLGSSHAINRYTMTSWTGVSNSSPVSWVIAATDNTSGSWTDLDTISGQSVWSSNEKRTFNFTNSTAYRYWRITMTATNASNAPELAEMEFLTVTSAVAGKVAQLNGWAVNY